MLLFKLRWTLIPQRGMQSLPIVKGFQILKDGLPSLRTALIGLPLDALGFEGAEKAFHHGIVVAIAFAAHTHHNARLSQPPSVILARILTTSIGVVQQAGARVPSIEGHLQGKFYQSFVSMAVNGPAYHQTRKDIKHHGELQPTLS